MNLQNDIGYVETERLLADIEKELHELYAKAAEESRETALEYMEQFLKADEEMRKRVERGEISPDDLNRWRNTHILTASRFQEMADVIADDLLNTDMIAMSIVNGHLPEVYAINMNYQTYLLERSIRVNTSFTLYNRFTVERLVRDHPDLLPVARIDPDRDRRWNVQHINSAVAQGIVQGDRIPRLAERLRMVTDMDERSSVRSARTMVTSAQNGGRMDAMHRLADKGVEMQKMWIATLDSRTRHWHRQMDGQRKPLDKPFVSDIGTIMYPADPNAHPANVYNCRCAVVHDKAKWNEEASDMSMRKDDKLGDMTYEEWKHEHDGQRVPPNPDNPSY
jgi:hypothetical protein